MTDVPQGARREYQPQSPRKCPNHLQEEIDRQFQPARLGIFFLFLAVIDAALATGAIPKTERREQLNTEMPRLRHRKTVASACT